LGKNNIEKITTDYFNSGFNCADSVLLSLVEAMNAKCSCIPKIATGFGAGFGRQGEVCGAITGAIMALGLKYGRSGLERRDREKKEEIYKIVDGFIKSFEKKFKNIRCIDLTGCNMLTPEGLKKFEDKNVHTNICAQLVAFSAKEAAKLLIK
jgi:C_GCAxxG_C_C family probable redox protein